MKAYSIPCRNTHFLLAFILEYETTFIIRRNGDYQTFLRFTLVQLPFRVDAIHHESENTEKVILFQQIILPIEKVTFTSCHGLVSSNI